MEFILEIDRWLFELINMQGHNDLLDLIMPWWRNKVFWVPFYAGLLLFMIFKFNWKALYFGLAIGLTVGIADTLSSQVIKKNVERLRPCNDPELKAEVQLLVRCGGGYSFTSSHATNHFAIAFFIAFTLGRLYRSIRWPLYFWAGSIALGQVYVGVHYPLDILIGGLIGALIGYTVAYWYNRYAMFRLNLGEPAA